jgi:glucose dehydrogenase
MILADLTIAGQPRKVIMQAPKNGFFYVLDRLTGEFISGVPYVVTTWATAIDQATGRPIETPQARYGQTPVRLAPSFVGAHHWQPMAFSPDTRLVYFAGQQNEATFQATPAYKYELAEWNLGMRMNAARGGVPDPVPASDPPPIRRFGFIVGWDPIARAPRWRIELAPGGGLLSTAGGVVFGSDTNRLLALHAGTGAILWEKPLYPGIATPVTYELDGRQYVSVLSGAQSSRMFTFELGGGEVVPAQQ